MKVTREFRGRLLVAYCEPDLVEHVTSALKMIEEADERVGGLRDGTVIQFGWAPLRLRAENQELVVCEPDYVGDVNQSVPSVNRTLKVVAKQTALLNALGVDGVTSKYNQGVVLKREVLDLHRVYMHRRRPVNDRDSGWYIGPVDDVGEPPDPSHLDAIYVYRLLNVRSGLLPVMALPPEYIVVFDGDEIEAVVDPSNQRVWPVPPAAGTCQPE